MWIHRCSLPISMDNLPIFDEVVIMLGNYEHFYTLMNNSGLCIYYYNSWAISSLAAANLKIAPQNRQRILF